MGFTRADDLEVLLRIWDIASGRCRCDKVEGNSRCRACRARDYRQTFSQELREALFDLNMVDRIEQVPR